MSSKGPRFSLVVAMDKNNLIGKDGDLPWRLPADLKHFKNVTMGKPIVMGRKTWESIGRPLPKRHNIVVTRDPSYEAEVVTVIHNLDELSVVCGDDEEVMIIGGAAIYEAFLPRAHRLYLTRVHVELEGDTHFPDFDKGLWDVVESVDRPADEKNEYDLSFQTLERRD